MRKIFTAFGFAALLATSASAQTPQPAPMLPNSDGDYLPDVTQEAPLSGAELLTAFSGKTHRGTYNFKRPQIDTFSFVETTSADGKTRHVHGDKVDVGTWRVMANVICFHYVNWDGGTHDACFNIYQRGNCYYHFGLGSGGGGSFTARSVHDGETPDCEPAMV